MTGMLSAAKVKISHRLAMHLHIDRFRLRNDAPMVSITLDDLPKSAATTGVEILEAHGARGTFYVSGALIGTPSPYWEAGDVEDVVAVHDRGHEIGCHTFSHKRVCDLNAPALSDEIWQNYRYLRAIDPSIKIANFAYPYGYGSFLRKERLKTAFQSCRSIMPGVNTGTVDLQFLRATPLIEGRIDRDGIERAFDDAQTNNGWLIFYTHDITGKPSPYGCTPALLNHALEAASRRKIRILSVAEALSCAGA